MHFDIVNCSDFRLPGGTSHSIASEVRVQADHGYRTALAHVNSNLQRRAHPWSVPILELLRTGEAEVLPQAQETTCDVLVVRHPSVVSENFFAHSLKPKAIVVIANHVPTDADGSTNYSVSEVNRIITRRFGLAPRWFPIGPVVRAGLEDCTEIDLSPVDWTNIVLPREAARAREVTSERPRIGRHSRNQAAKWPEDARDIRAAYPLDRQFDVRILGGAQPATEVLGKTPSNWTVHEFDAVPVREFLDDIDFWVYFHHSSTREAYGRAICEAMQAGCVVILPEYLRGTYGDAALYGEPSDVRRLVGEYSADTSLYSEQSARGRAFVDALGPEMHVARLQSLGISVTRTPHRDLLDSSASFASGSSQARVLFITSNGAGMGHLTRLLSIARQGESKFRPYFASLSSAVPVVGAYGYPFEYIASSGAMQVGWKGWNAYFAERLELTLERVRPDAVVFDGTMPYGGLLKVLERYPAVRIWIRRGMWKPSTSRKTLERGRIFDLTIEPGDFAAAYDQGPTKSARDALRVGPITLLEPQEILDREQSLERLGASDDRPRALITLGAGNINSISDAQSAAIRAFQTAGWQCFVTKPPIAATTGDQLGDALRTVKHYPLAEYARAFDAAVSATGYNSYHEWLSIGLPTIWIPNEETSVDDQVARARYSEDAGLGLYARGDDVDGIRRAVEDIVQPNVRAQMRENMARLHSPTGAQEAADAIARILA